MDEDDAVAITRRIIAAPSPAAFDTASGAIIRLFAALHQLTRRVVVLERQTGRLDQLDRRIVALERTTSVVTPQGSVTTRDRSNGHTIGDDFRIPEQGEVVTRRRGRPPGTPNKPGHRAGRPIGSANKPKPGDGELAAAL
jgi:hypothetical protein